MVSPLLQLPRELRDEIYFILFNSTRLSHGFYLTKVEAPREAENLKPARNSLAILQTCRQINAETHSVWLGRVTFRFENAKACMEKLSKVSQEAISQMRYFYIFNHWTVYGGALRNPRNQDVECSIPMILRLFPSLQLDCLTVLQGMCCGVAWLEQFISSGSGWRELRVIHRNGGHDLCSSPEEALAKLDEWQTMLWTRDGCNSGSTIKIYLGMAPDPHGMVNAAHSDITLVDRKLINAIIANGSQDDQYANTDLRAVIRRGKEVDIQRTADLVLQDQEPLEDLTDEKDLLGWDSFLDCCSVRCLSDRKILLGERHDEYVDVDDFRWHIKW